jgi:threonine dehydrogenase-like Zn-dependent dehydrogenase
MTTVTATVYKGSKAGNVIEGKETFSLGDEELLLKVHIILAALIVQITHSGLCGTDIHYFELSC